MKRQFSAFGVFLLALGALAMQACESTDSQNSYYNPGRYGYYHAGRYAQDNGYYQNSRYARDNGYYNEGYYVPNGYQTGRPTVDLHF